MKIDEKIKKRQAGTLNPGDCFIQKEKVFMKMVSPETDPGHGTVYAVNVEDGSQSVFGMGEEVLKIDVELKI